METSPLPLDLLHHRESRRMIRSALPALFCLMALGFAWAIHGKAERLAEQLNNYAHTTTEIIK